MEKPGQLGFNPHSAIKNQKFALALVLHHRVNRGIKLADLLNFRIGPAGIAAADNVDRGRVVELDGFAQIAVGIDQGSEFSTRVENIGQVDLMRGGEFFGVGAQVLEVDLQLTGENVVAEFIPQSLGMSI